MWVPHIIRYYELDLLNILTFPNLLCTLSGFTSYCLQLLPQEQTSETKPSKFHSGNRWMYGYRSANGPITCKKTSLSFFDYR